MARSACPACLGPRGWTIYPVCLGCLSDASIVPADLRQAWLAFTRERVVDADEYVRVYGIIVRGARAARRQRLIGRDLRRPT